MSNMQVLISLCWIILLYVDNFNCEQTEHIYLDHLCGSGIDSSERITCKYEHPGLYTSRRVYRNVEVIEFERFTNSQLSLETFPNIKKIYIKDMTILHEDACEHIQPFSFKGCVSVISNNANWTCICSPSTLIPEKTTSIKKPETTSTTIKTVTTSTAMKTTTTTTTHITTTKETTSATKMKLTSSNNGRTETLFRSTTIGTSAAAFLCIVFLGCLLVAHKLKIIQIKRIRIGNRLNISHLSGAPMLDLFNTTIDLENVDPQAQNNPQIIPAQNNPQVLPAQNNPQIIPAQDNPQVLPVQDNPQVLPVQDNPEVLPAQDNPQVLPVQNNPQIIPAQNNPQVLPAQNNPQVLPAQDNPQVLPAQDNPQVLPVQNNPQVLPAQDNPQDLSAQENSQTQQMEQRVQQVHESPVSSRTRSHHM